MCYRQVFLSICVGVVAAFHHPAPSRTINRRGLDLIVLSHQSRNRLQFRKVDGPKAAQMQANGFGEFFQLAHSVASEATKQVENIGEGPKIIFSNQILRSIFGTEPGWALLLVVSLIAVGQSFEFSKEIMLKSLPARFSHTYGFENNT